MTNDQPPRQSIRPAGIHLDRRTELAITWSDGRVSRYPLAFLRSKCPCATCRTGGASSGGGPLLRGTSLTVLPAGFDRRAAAQTATLVGNYAIQIIWADGHDTGIYDFDYLRSIDPASGPSGA